MVKLNRAAIVGPEKREAEREGRSSNVPSLRVARAECVSHDLAGFLAAAAAHPVAVSRHVFRRKLVQPCLHD